MRNTLFLFLCFLQCSHAIATVYELKNDPIDVIIPSTEKDLDTLDLCIQGIRRNCTQIRRIIVISNHPLTNQAEWFDEKNFPFSKKDIAYHLMHCNQEKAQNLLSSPNSRVGWYLQQLLKLYASYTIPGLSSNILLLDSDTIFLNPVRFTNHLGAALFNTGEEFHTPYFEHMNKLLPGLTRLWPAHSGICHHMLIQKSILDDLFHSVESYQNMEFWKAFCLCVEENQIPYSGASEYEIYFNFALARSNQLIIRPLKWENTSSLKQIPYFKEQNFTYISAHNYFRENKTP